MLIYTKREKESGGVRGFPSNFLKKSWVPPFYCLVLLLLEMFSCGPFFLLTPLPKCKKSLPLSETFKLLLGCQYGHIIVRRMHTKLIRCVKMFLLLNSTSNTKDFIKIVNNLSFYFGNLGTAIFKEHFSLSLSIGKNFYCNLPFYFNYRF